MFLLITPMHNEADQVDELVKCVQNSTLQPDIWMIVDDNSSDNTNQKLQQWAKNLSYIRIHKLKKSAEYMEFHISEVLKAAEEQLQEYIPKASYIGFLDADIRFAKNYWARLKKHLDENDRIGIISGVICAYYGQKQPRIEPFQRIDNPRGGLRMLRRECFEEIGGVRRSRTWDAIMNVLARLRGWQLAVLTDLYVLSSRPTDDRFGMKQGEFSRGKREWHLHQPFWQVFVRAVFKSAKGNLEPAIYYLKGYLSEKKNKGEQFPDPEVRRYYRRERAKEWLRSIKANIFGGKNPHALIPVRNIDISQILDE